MPTDPFNLERFVTAQAPIFGTVLDELKAGCKRTHWMWFVFPQLRALGRSQTAQFYGIASREEARAYHLHPVLGPRLLVCTRTVLQHAGDDLHAIFGSPDEMKFRSCMTLFEAVAPEEASFGEALRTFCAGERDPHTLRVLGENRD